VNSELAYRERNNKITDWFALYGKRIRAYIRSRINDLEAAEDAAQDVWLQLTRQTEIETIEQISNWLFTTARNRVTDYYRKKKSIPFSTLDRSQTTDTGDTHADLENDLSFELWAEEYLPDSILESKEFWSALQLALDKLPAEQRMVFVAHELEGVSFKKMAEETGLSVNTLLARKRYAVLRLRVFFSNY